MARTQIPQVRRKELLKAALKVMQRDGLHAATIDKIAKEAGASRGVVHHYFEDKDDLIEQTMRFVHAARGKAIAERLRSSQSPSERLWSIVSVSLQKKFFRHDLCNVLISFNAKAFDKAGWSRLLKTIRKRERSNLVHALRPLTSENDVSKLVLGIMSILEACRLWAGYIPSFGSSRATALVLAFLKQEVPSFDHRVASR
jgi:TetR/AcrR family transcriptional repressor of bet genes